MTSQNNNTAIGMEGMCQERCSRGVCDTSGEETKRLRREAEAREMSKRQVSLRVLEAGEMLTLPASSRGAPTGCQADRMIRFGIYRNPHLERRSDDDKTFATE